MKFKVVFGFACYVLGALVYIIRVLYIDMVLKRRRVRERERTTWLPLRHIGTRRLRSGRTANPKKWFRSVGEQTKQNLMSLVLRWTTFYVISSANGGGKEKWKERFRPRTATREFESSKWRKKCYIKGERWKIKNHHSKRYPKKSAQNENAMFDEWKKEIKCVGNGCCVYLLRVPASIWEWTPSYNTITFTTYVNEWCTCSDKAIDIIMRKEIPAEMNKWKKIRQNCKPFCKNK